MPVIGVRRKISRPIGRFERFKIPYHERISEGDP